MKVLLLLLSLTASFIVSPFGAIAQSDLKARIESKEAEIQALEQRKLQMESELETERLAYYGGLLRQWGLPLLEAHDTVVHHSLYSLVYSRKHQQAIWVAHVIAPEVREGRVGRTNDFRYDSLVPGGSCSDRDYFSADVLPDGTLKYTGYGFDRGHLAPSADFRWSTQALSESYFYSNMSPQRAVLNRESWARLEDRVRSYAERNQRMLLVCTGPVLRPGLPRIEQGVRKPSIPNYYFKVVVDREGGVGIGFIMPNARCEYPAESYAVPIDSVEALTGFDFFSALPDAEEAQLEASRNVSPFLPPREQTDALPISPQELDKNQFNTVQAKLYAGKNEVIEVCGTVVSTKLSSKGNVFLNLDKGFPNQIFTVTIFKDQLVNFSYEPHELLMGKTICVRGKVSDFNGTPSMSISDEQSVEIRDEP